MGFRAKTGYGGVYPDLFLNLVCYLFLSLMANIDQILKVTIKV